MPAPRAHRETLARTADGLLLAAATVTPLAVGAVYGWAQQLLLALAALAALAVALERRRAGRHVYPGAAALLLLLLATLCALQLLPLPRALVGLLSPRSLEILETTLPPIGVGGPFPLSLDPPATAVELGKMLAYALLAAAAAQRSRERDGRAWLLRAVALGGVVALVAATVQTLGNVPRPYGRFGVPPHAFLISTFVNPNHAACFFGVSAFAAVGLALAQRDRARAALWGLGAVLLAAAVPLTLSRGGILALVASLLFGGWLLWARGREARRALGWLHLGFAAAVAVAVYLSYNPISAELATLDPRTLQGDKSFLWREAIAIAPRFFATGIGRGAFGRVFPIFKSVEQARTFDYAESTPIQLLVDLGLVVGILVVLALCAAFALALRRHRGLPELAALCGLFFAGLHSLIDFSLEVPGVAVPVVLLATSLAGHTATGSSRGHRARSAGGLLQRRLRGTATALGVLALAAVAAAGLAWGHHHDGLDLDRAISSARDPRRLAALGIQGLRRHPTDYVYALAIARGEQARGAGHQERALRWLNRALYLNPTYAPSHRMVAQALWQGGHRAQALAEWRRAIELAPTLEPRIVADLLSLQASYPELGAGVPQPRQLALCQSLRGAGRQAEAERCLRDLLAALPQDTAAHWTAFAWAMAQGRVDDAERHAARLVELAPNHNGGYLAQGRVAMARGDETRAVALWREATARVEDARPLWRELFEVALRGRRYQEARDHLEAYRRAAGGDRAHAAQGHLLAGRLYEAQELLAKARREYLQAHRLSPSDLEALHALARCETRLGYLDRAVERYQRVLSLSPGARGAAEAIERLEAERAARQERSRWDQVLREPEE